MTVSKAIRFEKALLLLWFVLNLGIGVLTVHEYGTSIDEPNNQHYAADTLAAYPSFFGILYEPNYDSSYDGHGPAFVTVASLLIKVVQAAFPNAFATDLWHYSYFITFQLTGLCLYWLTRRWFNRWTAWGILILFGTQPLLLGHAFINPKDVPFMFLLTLSVMLGLRLVDGVEPKEGVVSLKKPVTILTKKFQATDARRRRRFLSFLAVASAIALTLAVFSNQMNPLIAQVITFFYAAEPASWAGRIFNSIASPASNVPLDDYVNKAVKLSNRALLGLLYAGVLLFLAYLCLLINNTTLPAFLRHTWNQRRGLVGFLLGSGRALRNSRLILAGVTLGLATAVRAVAPIAGIIVFLSLFARVRSRAWVIAIAYFLVAGIVTYIAWPRLWDAPFQRYLEGLGIISDFTYGPGQVLFDGRIYRATDLPRFYLPALMSIQFTEPAVLGIYVGLGLLVLRLLRGRLQTDLLLFVSLTFALPFLGLIVLNPKLYNNFRQALFLTPAMFILAAFTLELALSKIIHPWARLLLIAAISLPGVYSSVSLYPYEYVYYNSLVGGTAGAQNRFELDYWRVSLREMALKMNEVAPAGAIIVVRDPARLFARYARPDLIVDKPVDSTVDLSRRYDYLVQLSRWERWELYPEARNVVVVERAGAVLATAKDVKDFTEK